MMCMSRSFICLSVLVIAGSWAAAPVRSASIPIENASFEAPVVDPNGFPVVPDVDGWTEIDNAPLGDSVNTGVFLNTPPDSPDHIVNADGSQLAFLGSEAGNALEQDLATAYKVGCDYRLTVAVGVSMLLPPSAEIPADTLELVLYYRDGDEPVDIVSRTVTAMPWSQLLQDFFVYLPKVQSGDTCAGKTVGVAIRATGTPGGFWDLDNVRLVESQPVTIPIENASFEAPVVDPNGFTVVPDVDGWTEIDNAPLGDSLNTGVFLNTPPDTPDHIVNADGSQLAFLGSEAGNALEQDLAATYNVGCDYRLTVAAGVSDLFPPSTAEPVDALELVLFYRDGSEVVDVAGQTVEAAGLSSTQLTDVSLYLPTVQPGDAWVGIGIGVALRATGMPGGFWVLDDVRLIELLPGPGLASTVAE
jgi:hypothetical protein